MLNPFVVGDYVSQEYFCGRSNEAKVLEECIREGKNVVLHSARRLGKDHLIEHVFHKASFKEEFGGLCVDASICGSLKEFASVLVDGIFRSLRNDHGSFEKLDGLCRRLRLSMTMGPSSEVESPSFSLGSIREPEKIIEESFSFIEGLDRKVVSAIEAFEKLASFRDVDEARALGKIIESHSSVRMIFSLCDSQGVSERFLEETSVVFGSAKRIRLEPIELSEYCSFARSKFQEAGKRISAEIFQSIYSKFSGCTGPIPLILNRLFAETPKNGSVTNEILDNVINSIVDEYSVFFKEALSRLSFNQKCLFLPLPRTVPSKTRRPQSS